jgi:heme exporter protein C
MDFTRYMLEFYGPRSGLGRMERVISAKSLLASTRNSDAKVVSITPFPAPNKFVYPYLGVLEETIRNLFFHVPMWFAMIVCMIVSVIFSILYLSGNDLRYDISAKGFAATGVLFGVLGLVTGAVWARYTWGQFWSWDIKQNTSAIAMLIYMAYFVLRGSLEDLAAKARISSVYNVFAFAALIPLLFVIPRMKTNNSLHPGADGNPAFSSYDLDNVLRLVFYPAVIGWILLAVWVASLFIRYERAKSKVLDL